jgi:hypothetical protein
MYALEVEDRKMPGLCEVTMYLCYEFVLDDTGNIDL